MKQWFMKKYFSFCFNKYSVILYWVWYNWITIDWLSKDWFVGYKELTIEDKECIKTIQNCDVRVDHYFSFPFKPYWIMTITSKE